MINDYISQKLIPATPEEVDAVQPFLKKLVEDYGYPSSHIASHPQYRVKARPSDRKKKNILLILLFFLTIIILTKIVI